jgi:hypothetical protein
VYRKSARAQDGDTLAALQAASNSIELALATYQSQLPDVVIRRYADDRKLWAAALAVLSGARRQVVVASHAADAFGAPAGELPGLLAGLRDRRLTVRLLCPPEALVTGQERARLGELRRRGVDVRIARHVRSDFAIVDGCCAVIGAPAALAGARAGGARAASENGIGPVDETWPGIIIESPVLASAFLCLLDGVHATARRVDTFLQCLDPDKAEFMVAILGMLSRGRKDATAARALGLSVRTYRRRMADVLAWLDASSRFEAGVRAAELGLVWPECLAVAPQLPDQAPAMRCGPAYRTASPGRPVAPDGTKGTSPALG